MTDNRVFSIAKIAEFFKEYPSQLSKGENSFSSGNVLRTHFDPEVKPVLLKGEVQASMKNRVYSVEISLDADDGIVSATCSCPRGELVCHHMAALCVFGHHHFSVTDKPCTWNAPRKDAENDNTQNITQLYQKKKNYNATSREATEEEEETFLKYLGEPVGVNWIRMPEPSDISLNLVPAIQDIVFSKEYLDASDKEAYFLGATHVSHETIIKVAEITTGQYRNENWLVLRKHRITASYFGQVIKACRRKKFPPSLFKSLMGGYNLDGVKAIQWGRDNECEAVDCFQRELKLKVLPTGLWLHDCGFLGASPDGLIGEDSLLEIKCPYKYKDVSLSEVLKTDRTYILYKNEKGDTEVNREHPYWDQIQGQLHITGRNICYLLVWTPLEVEVVIIEKSNEWAVNIGLLKDFFVNTFLPYLCT